MPSMRHVLAANALQSQSSSQSSLNVSPSSDDKSKSKKSKGKQQSISVGDAEAASASGSPTNAPTLVPGSDDAKTHDAIAAYEDARDKLLKRSRNMMLTGGDDTGWFRISSLSQLIGWNCEQELSIMVESSVCSRRLRSPLSRRFSVRFPWISSLTFALAA